MQLALALSGKRPASEAVEVARMAEEAGFSQVWVTEDYCERGAFSLAGAIASSTKTIRVGLGVVNPWTRHPMLTAMETAALAELAPGRVMLGLGASNQTWMEEQLGIPFERPLTVLEDAVRVLRAAFTTGHVDVDATRFSTHAALSFTPPGPVPLVLGVKGPRALALAGRIGDGILLSALASPSYVRWARKLARSIPVSGYVVVSCDEDHVAARDRVRPFVATFLGVHGDHPITQVAGVDAERARALRAAWKAGAPRGDLVTESDLDDLVVAGDPDHCAATLARFVEAGLDTVVVLEQHQGEVARYLQRIQDLWGIVETRTTGTT